MMISFDMDNPLAHANGPLVVKLGGAAVDDPAAGKALWDAVAALHQSEKKGVVLVHGGGAAIDRRLAALGMKSDRKEGIRITPDEHIGEVVATLNGVINPGVVAELQTRGVPAVGLTLADGMFAKCVKSTKFSFDPGRVGEVVGGDPRLPLSLLRTGFMPVFSSIGFDEQGLALNVNADEAAASVAWILGARGMILLTDVEGILDQRGALVPSLHADQVDNLIDAGVIGNGMIPKARGAVQAANASGAPVSIASWKDPANLLRIARGESVGTRVLPGVRRADRLEAALGV